MARHRVAVALLVAQPLATELDGLRRALGAAERERVAGTRVAVIESGGNVDAAVLGDVLAGRTPSPA